MASLHNLANNLLHPALHNGSQLLPDDASNYVPGSDVDEDNTIDINLPDINVVDTPVVGLKRGRASSDIWTWFTNDANSHHLKSATVLPFFLFWMNQSGRLQSSMLFINLQNMEHLLRWSLATSLFLWWLMCRLQYLHVADLR